MRTQRAEYMPVVTGDQFCLQSGQEPSVILTVSIVCLTACGQQACHWILHHAR